MIQKNAGNAALLRVEDEHVPGPRPRLESVLEKFVVDYANGIDVARDHIRVQRSSSGFYERLCDNFTDKRHRRQTEINASLADGVAGSLRWLTELTVSTAKTNHALTQVKERVSKLQGALAEVAEDAADTRDRLERLERDLDRRMDDLTRELQGVVLGQRADKHLQLVLGRWGAGVFADLPPAGRCYATLEELRWGAFGDFYRNTPPAQHATHLELLRLRAVSQLAADLRVDGVTRVDTAQWLHADQPAAEMMEELAYLGEWAEPEREPFVSAVARPAEPWPQLFPHRCSAATLSERMVAEVFKGAAP